MRTFHSSVMWTVVALALAGCQAGGQPGESQSGGGLASAAEGFGNIGRGVAAGLRVGEAVEKAQEKFDDRQEYYIGRMAAAQIIHQYPLYVDDNANRYVNVVGKTLAEFSDLPQVFAGYNFHIIESNDINAFAMPGAFVFVTRGLLRCADNEDELAAILAHEIGHVQRKHALSAISDARTKEIGLVAIREGAKAGAAGRDFGELVNKVSAGVTDMLRTVMVKGYSREQEAQADRDAVEILRRTGYDPHAMASMLQKMKSRIKPDAHDFASTHPSPDERMKSVKGAIGEQASAEPDPARAARFAEALKAARAQ